MSDTRNRIELIGSEEDLKGLLERYSRWGSDVIKERDRKFCYLNQTGERGFYDPITHHFEFGGRVFDAIPDGFYIELVKKYNNFPDFSKIIPPPYRYADLIYGMAEDNICIFWIQWCYDNWGTYQNAFGCKALSENVFLFDSYSCVSNLIERISLECPNVTILYELASLDIGFECAKYTFQNGELEKTILEADSKDGDEMIYKLYPEFKGEDFHLVLKGLNLNV